jgi:hypothetical protein
MRKYLLFWVIVLLGVLCVGLLTSCRDDINVPFPPSLVGNYEGTYSLLRAHSASGGTDTTYEQLIKFRFTATDYAMSMDDNIDEADRVFCDVSGEYTLGTGAILTATDSNTTKALCTESWAPTGSFSIDQTTGMTELKRIYVDSNNVGIEMKLTLDPQ